MNLDKLNQWLTLLANIGVVVGIIFLAMEIRTNTETNKISVLQNYSSNWMLLHAQQAESKELSSLIETALTGGELSATENRQFQTWALQYVSQAHDMLRHYDAGLISERELRIAFQNIRGMVENDRIKKALQDAGVQKGSRLAGLILEKDGFDRWLYWEE